jgi:hypothetical protein
MRGRIISTLTLLILSSVVPIQTVAQEGEVKHRVHSRRQSGLRRARCLRWRNSSWRCHTANRFRGSSYSLNLGYTIMKAKPAAPGAP